MINTDAVLGGLVGSLGTLIVTRIFDYFQTRQLHKLSLKKELFMRKINVFEKTVSRMTAVHNGIMSMAALLKTFPNDETRYNDEQYQIFFKSINKPLEELSTTVHEAANSIDLYIDIEVKDNEINHVQQLLDTVAKVSQLISDIKIIENLISDESLKNEHNNLSNRINSKKNLLIEKVDQLTDFSNNLRSIHINIAKQLRIDIKKYE